MATKKAATSAGKKKAAATPKTKAFETKPAKKLTVEKLERLQGGGLNQAHNRFVVDRESKVAWVPSWVEELRVTNTEKVPTLKKPKKQ